MMRPRCSLAVCALALTLLLGAGRAHAIVLWTENAEGGAANIATNVSEFPLIQSDIVSEGNHAFHLANPNFADKWFSITQPIAIQSDTNLFFQSQMGFVAPGQTAKVQLSTDGGVNWPTTLYSQVGTSNGSAPMEGGFSLRTVDLSSYANQTARFRFLLDYTPGGLAFTQTDVGVGWYIDDIQFADSFQKQAYSIGNPTAEEQLYLELINRARADASGEAQRLAAATDPDIISAYNFFGINPVDIVNQFNYYVNLNPPDDPFDNHAQPLAFNEKLLTAARLHSQDMFDHEFQGHNSSGSPPSPLVPFGGLGDRLDIVGYTGAAGENVYSYASSPEEGHAAFDVDWGNVTNFGDFYNPAFDGQGMQNAAGHRLNIHNKDFKEVGIGVINGTNGSVGPQVVTQDFGNPGNIALVTGVVYEDLNANNFYDIGEGRPGVRIDLEGSAYFAISTSSGGYALPAAGDGVFDVMFSGGGFSPFTTTATISSGLNVKIDYLAQMIASNPADFDNDGDVDGQDLVQWRGDFGGSGSDADDDGDSDGNDFLVWQRELAPGQTAATNASIPEPPGQSLAVISLVVAAIASCKAQRRG
jgi:uncharacterized protein YkwD